MRRARGAAMVESAVVAAFMLVMFACLWSAVSYHAGKLRAMNEARYSAWQVALGTCDGSEDAIEDIGETTDEAGAGSLPNTKQSDQFLSVRAGSLANESGYVDLTRKRTVTFSKLVGGGSHEMKSRMHMRCNEPTPPETAKDLFMTALGVAKFSYGF